MVTTLQIDTLSLARKLRDANGDPDAMAQAMAEGVGSVDIGHLATKADLAEVRGELKLEIAELRGEMREGFARIDVKFEEVNAKFEQVNAKFETVNANIERMGRNLVLWLIPTILGTGGLILAASRLLSETPGG